ncbi:MAG: ATP-dependent sacrificial sulfur transferase LarE [Pontiellaceae bacterium]
MHTPHEKEQALIRLLRNYETLAVAYSGGVDSTYLADCANEALGNHAIILIADSPSLPRSELKEAIELAQKREWNLEIIHPKEHENPAYLANQGDRCFHCKDALFNHMKHFLEAHPSTQLAYGAIEDDRADHRPGNQAASNHNAVAPLQQVLLYKSEIRQLSSARGLPTAEKASFACLGSRFPTGTPINLKKLSQVEAAEEILRQHGYRQYRVRHHEEICRIEINPSDFEKLLNERESLLQKIKATGYRYITLDINGYNTGSTA